MAQVGLRPGDGVYYEDDLFRVEEIYLRGRADLLVGEAAGQVVALGGLRPVDAATVEMVRLRVHPDLQGRGYGRTLVTALERRADELGYRALRADTTIRQRVAIGLYRSLGWRETSRRVTGSTVTVYFGKDLPGALG